MKAMAEEHCQRSDSRVPFTTATGITTNPAIEWEYVTEPVAGRVYPSRDDKPRPGWQRWHAMGGRPHPLPCKAERAS